MLPFKEEVVTVLLLAVRGVLYIYVTLLPFKDEVVTVLLLAVNAVRVVTSHKNMALSKPADAT